MGPARAHSTRLPARGARRYPSDLTDAQWQVIAAHLPAERTGRRGRPRIWPARRIVEAILYLNRTGCAWRYLPGDFPPWQTVYGYFAAWRDDGTLARLHGQLRAQLRTAAGRQPEPTAAVIDSQSVRPPTPCPRPAGAGMRPRKSMAASGTSRWMPLGCCSMWSSPPPVCKTATPPGRCC